MKLHHWLLLNIPNYELFYLTDNLSKFLDNFPACEQLEIRNTANKIQIHNNLIASRLTIMDYTIARESLCGYRCNGIFVKNNKIFQEYKNEITPLIICPFRNHNYPKNFVYLEEENQFLSFEDRGN